ncbi:hypothetical protein [Reyranella sp.]|uniref:hypothetical protein n=1 Tax=Reyranella sp. TaxID=1929291 RepID=UPI0040362C8E
MLWNQVAALVIFAALCSDASAQEISVDPKAEAAGRVQFPESLEDEVDRLTKERAGQKPREINEQACRDDWSKCADNKQLAETYRKYIEIRTACQIAAGRLAKYGKPNWGGWTHRVFGQFLPGDTGPSSGYAILFDNEVQFQNGFGAMVNSSARCKYDLRNEKVLEVTVRAR